MNTRMLLGISSGVVIGLIGGFLLANSINRAEIDDLRAKSTSTEPRSANTNTANDSIEIGDAEIRAKIAQADANPDDFAFQKNLGGALYRYSSMKNDAALAAEARRLLSRAIALVPDDHSVAVDLGNSYLDLGYSGKDAASFQKARELFINALAAKPGDDAARTDLALSYLLDVSPDFHRAEEEFQRALKTDPKQERALQFLTVCYLQQGKFGDAAKMLDRLKAANPGNEKIAELMAQITAKQAAPIR